MIWLFAYVERHYWAELSRVGRGMVWSAVRAMCFRTSVLYLVFAVALAGFDGGQAFAAQHISWREKDHGRVKLTLVDGASFVLPLDAHVEGIYLDERKHKIGNSVFLSIFQVSSSSPSKPMGLCGSGREVRLHVYELRSHSLREKYEVLVGSCINNISIVSQNSGKAEQDGDFSSVVWSEQGFTIEWFSNRDVTGRPLQSTKYILKNGFFIPQDVPG